MERVIEVRGIVCILGDHEVLRGVDFAANKGEVTCIIAPPARANRRRCAASPA